MKKTLVIIALVLTGAMTTFAQDAKSVLDRYMKATNLSSMSINKDYSMLVEMLVKANQGGMEMEIKMKSIIKQPEGKMNMSMNVMGQDMVIVVNADKGWMKMGDNVMPLPADQLSQMSSQGNALGQMMWDESKYGFEYLGTEGNYELVKITPKDEATLAQIQGLKAKFNKSTGLLESIDMQMQGVVDAETIISEYKQFGDYKIPTVMTVKMSGAEVSKVTITNLQMNIPTTNDMFEEPK